MFRIPSLRCFSLLAFIAGTTLLFGQKPLRKDYLVQLTGMIGKGGEKLVLSAIRGSDPNAVVSTSSEAQQAKVRTTANLDRDQLNAWLNPFGVTVVAVLPWLPMRPAERTARVDEDAFPLRNGTGNPGMDDADHRARKEAWIRRHPQEYAVMCEGAAPQQH